MIEAFLSERSQKPEAEAVGRRDVIKAAIGASVVGLSAAARGDAASEPQAEEEERRGAGEKTPIVDIHNHPYWLGHDPPKMVANMDQQGIERAWLLSWEVPEHEMSPDYHKTLNPLAVGIPFADVVRAAELYHGRFVPGYAIDPRHPHARSRLEAAVAIHGVRVYGELKLRVQYDDPDCISIFHLCADLGLPVVFHLEVTLPPGAPQTTRQWWYGGDIDNIERALKQCPRTVFLGHAPGFWREISGDAVEEPLMYPKDRPVKPGGKLLKLLDAYPNLHCDLSAGSGLTALSRDPEFSRKFLIAYQDRCLFGRDQFDNALHELLVSLSLPQDVLRKILSGNAYRLVPPA